MKHIRRALALSGALAAPHIVLADPLERLNQAVPMVMLGLAFEDAQSHWPAQTSPSPIGVVDLEALRRLTASETLGDTLKHTLPSGYTVWFARHKPPHTETIPELLPHDPETALLFASYEARNTAVHQITFASSDDAALNFAALEPYDSGARSWRSLTGEAVDLPLAGERGIRLDVRNRSNLIYDNNYVQTWMSGERWHSVVTKNGGDRDDLETAARLVELDRMAGRFWSSMETVSRIAGRQVPEGFEAVEMAIHVKTLTPKGDFPWTGFEPENMTDTPAYFGAVVVGWRNFDGMIATTVALNHMDHCDQAEGAVDAYQTRWNDQPVVIIAGEETVPTARDAIGQLATTELGRANGPRNTEICVTTLTTAPVMTGVKGAFPDAPPVNYQFKLLNDLFTHEASIFRR